MKRISSSDLFPFPDLAENFPAMPI